MSIDLIQLIVRLGSDSRGGRHHVDDVAVAICEVSPHIDGADILDLVRDTIEAGEQQRLWGAARTTVLPRRPWTGATTPAWAATTLN
ncbi:hypothetical protein [Actinoplanes sp. NPDC051851]|uniref:hypothetical protein n=1 Tax=Actinoplanes sp. NPDC051851 TaxID=3154753 RepID=UPI0034188844